MNFFSWLTVLFIAAKLFHVVDWSWWFVFTPTYIGLAFFILLFALATAGTKK